MAFAAFYGGAKSGFKFVLAGVTRTDNAEWYNARVGGNDERDMKRTLHRGGFDTLNVYTNLAGGYLGYAYLPGLPDSHLWQDGIVLDWESMPGASPRYAGRYDLGFTLVARGRPLVQPGAHVLRRLQRQGRLRRRHAGDAGADAAAARRARTRAPSRASIRSTTTWTTRTTPVTTSSPRGRSPAQQDAWLYYRALVAVSTGAAPAAPVELSR